MPKRKNRRLKWAFTVRRAIFSCLEISSLSQPCRSSSTTCCSLGRNDLSSITDPSNLRFDLPCPGKGIVPSGKATRLRKTLHLPCHLATATTQNTSAFQQAHSESTML